MKSLILLVTAFASSLVSAAVPEEAGLLTYERVLNAHRFCQRLCQLTPGCRNDPHAHGSYCKLWQTIPVCFGLYQLPYHRPREGLEGGLEAEEALVDSAEVMGEAAERGHFHRVRYCFQPFSRRCDDSVLKPVRCGFFPQPRE